MNTLALSVPPKCSDPAIIFEIFNGNFGNKILTAATVHLKVLNSLSPSGKSFEDLRRELGLAKRPAQVVVTALLAFGLVSQDGQGVLHLTDLSRVHMLSDSPHTVIDYLDLAAEARGVSELVQSLRTDQPISAQYIKSRGVRSVMEDRETAQKLTRCLAGRAMNCAPYLADCYPIPNARLLVDVGGGTGIFSAAFLQKNPRLRAIVLDLPFVLEVAKEFACRYGVSHRMEFIETDMFDDPLPKAADVYLLSNVLHDWGEEKCDLLVQKCSDALSPGGHLLIHDAFLDDNLSGPLEIAIYSVILFHLTEGRAYSVSECEEWLRRAGLEPKPVIKTLVHCSLLPALKSVR